MIKHKVKVPDGSVLTIETPEGATEAQVIDFASEHYEKAMSEVRKKRATEEKARERSDKLAELQVHHDGLNRLAAAVVNAIADMHEQSLEDRQQLVDAIQKIKMPEIVIPEIVIPEIRIPEIKIPDIVMPNIVMPEIVMPKAVAPNITVPEINIPPLQVISHHLNKKNVLEWKFTMVRDNRGLLTDITAKAVKLGE